MVISLYENRYGDVGTFVKNGVELLRQMFRAVQDGATVEVKPRSWFTSRATCGWILFHGHLLRRGVRCRHDYRGAVLAGGPYLSDAELQTAVERVKCSYAEKERRRQKQVRRAKTGRR